MRSMQSRCLMCLCGMVVVAGVLAGISCSEVNPETGRRQLSLVSDAQMNRMAEEEYRNVLAQSRLSRNREQTEMVRRVGEGIRDATLAHYADRPAMLESLRQYEWEFALIDDEQVNAWAMPGGKIAFYTGILPVCGNEAGVAVVMGHEVAHAVLGHGRERYSRALVMQGAMAGLAVALDKKEVSNRDVFLNVFGATANVGAMLPNSRVAEYEADELGLYLMARAGYDPREAVAFWERMQGAGCAKPPEFLSTHPADANRIRRMREVMPKALDLYNRHPRAGTSPR